MLLKEKFNKTKIKLVLTCILGFIFLFLQRKEYISSCVSINSLIYATTFFLLTGFHGFHVTIGLIFLIVTLFRFTQKVYSAQKHQGLEFAI